MTTIVKHRRTGNEYILLSINSEADRASPSRFISELFEREKSAVSYSATLCDVRGNIFLAYIDDLIVIEVDGVKPADILPPPTYETSPAEENLENFSTAESDRGDRQFDEDFDEEFEDDEFLEKPESQPQAPQVEVVDSLDAPNQNNDEDEEWI